jgi:katanin p60 ATPase-containing subunit A1
MAESAMPSLTRRAFGLVRIVALLLGAAFLTAVFQGRFPFPSHWLYVAIGWIFGLVLAGSIYIKSRGRRPPVSSMLDMAFSCAWAAIRLLLALNAIWAGYGMFHGAPFSTAMKQFFVTLLGLPGSLASPSVNLFQIACLLPLATPLFGTCRAILRSKRSTGHVAPKAERRIADKIASAAHMITMKKHKQAALLLDDALETLARLANRPADETLTRNRQILRQEAENLRQQALALESGAAAPAAQTGPSAGAGESGRASEANHYREYLESLRVRSTVAWSDVAGLDEAVGEIKSAFAMSLASAPDGVSIDAPRRILLYGPPGTGKTLLTAAVSSGFDAPFFSVKVSDVLSKFFGESTRLIAALFEMALEQAPAVLFFDEIEALCGSRDSGRMEGEERRMVASLLAELDGLKTKGENKPVFTLCATNLPWQIDPAVLSRFEKRFYVPLPDEEARMRILDLHLGKRGIACGVPLEQLAGYTRGYSGRELSRLCQEAVRRMTEEANPQMGSVVDRGAQALANYKIKIAPLTIDHLNAAFKKVRPQTDPATIERYERWADNGG